MPLSDTAFAALADVTLARLAESLETLDADGDADIELLNGVLTVTLPSGQEFVVNRHAPSRQLWLSSPLSGGLHFDYDEGVSAFALADGTRLDTLLKAEVESFLGED